MKFSTKLLAASLVLMAGIAIAKDGVTNPTVMAREALMGTIGMNVGILSKIAKGETAYDAAAAEAAKATLIASAADIGAKFMENAVDPMAAAKPEVWTNWEDFLKKAGNLKAAAEALDVTSAETIGAGLGAVGGACKDCHTTFRM